MFNRRAGKIIGIIYCALFIPICLLLNSCSSDKVEPVKNDVISSDSIPSQESLNSTVTFSDSGKVKAVLKAGRIRVYSKFNFTLIDENPSVDFYKAGIYSSTLTGKRGKIYDLTRDVEVIDSVKMVSTDSTVLNADKLYWVNKTQKVKSDGFVHIQTKTEDIRGTGFEADQSLKNYKIYKVSGQVEK